MKRLVPRVCRLKRGELKIYGAVQSLGEPLRRPLSFKRDGAGAATRTAAANIAARLRGDFGHGWPTLRAMESRRLRPVVRSRRRFLADRFAGTAKAPDFSLIP